MDKVTLKEIAIEIGISDIEIIKRASELSYDVISIGDFLTRKEADALVDYASHIPTKKVKQNTKKIKIVKKSSVKRIQRNNQSLPSNLDISNFSEVQELKAPEIENVKICISNLKTIKSFEWEFEFRKGINAIIGANGIGKSSFIITLAKLIHPNVFRSELIGNGYSDTSVEYIFDNQVVFTWIKSTNWREKDSKRMPKINGYFESSILGGKRFRIYNNLKEIEVNVGEDDISPASEFIRENMNYIMFGKNTEEERFKTLCRVEGKRKKKRINSNTFEHKLYKWYVLKTNNHYIHEYFLSTGEYFLLSLLKFIEELVIKERVDELAMIIIDEIELSLHTLAQRRLVEKLTEFSEKYNILVIFTTHSLQIIEKMNPNDIYLFENKKGICSVSSPSYPGYLTSRLETHKYYDRIVLVEDDLAEFFITKAIGNKEEDINNVSYKIIPIGGWEKVLEIYLLNKKQKFYGDAEVIVVLDGDQSKTKKVKQGINKQINKRFLPLENIEKYVVELIVNNDENFIRFIERKIQPTVFGDLGFFIEDNPFENTEKIKNLYSKFVKVSIKVMTNTSEIEFQKDIIDFILKTNVETPEYKKFIEEIIIFINGK